MNVASVVVVDMDSTPSADNRSADAVSAIVRYPTFDRDGNIRGSVELKRRRRAGSFAAGTIQRALALSCGSFVDPQSTAKRR